MRPAVQVERHASQTRGQPNGSHLTGSVAVRLLSAMRTQVPNEVAHERRTLTRADVAARLGISTSGVGRLEGTQLHRSRMRVGPGASIAPRFSYYRAVSVSRAKSPREANPRRPARSRRASSGCSARAATSARSSLQRGSRLQPFAGYTASGRRALRRANTSVSRERAVQRVQSSGVVLPHDREHVQQGRS